MSSEALLRRNEQWERAIRERDAQAARAVLAEDFALVLVQPSPAVVSVDQWLAMLPEYVVHEWVVEERLVDLKEDVAAVLQRIRMRATVSGTDRSGLFAISDIWLRIEAEWRVWRRHSTPFTAGDLN